MTEARGRAIHKQARQWHRQGQLDEAIQGYHRALELSPSLVAARNDLGAALLQAGRLDEAEAELRRAAALHPEAALVRCNLGNLLQQSGRIAEAIAELGRAVELEPSLVLGHYALGNAWGASAEWDRAAAAFRRALDIDPRHGPSHFNLGNALHQMGRLDDAVEAYRHAVDLAPDNPEALSNLGTVLKELNRAREAEESYRRALRIRPDDRTLEHNLRSALNRQLPAWHFPMLADEARHQAYRRAIERAVDGRSRVLDVGTGSGLLAMMAARAGAASVIASEMSPGVAAAARQVVADNGYAGRVTVVNKKSTSLRLGEDLAQPANVVVSEILDVGLLGEGVLPSLRHAQGHLLTPDPVVIPRGATVFGALVELPRLGRVNPVRDISGFDLSAFDRFRAPDDYLDIRLDREPHRMLSAPARVVSFDFSHLPAFVPHDAPSEVRLDVTSTADGVVHAVAFWFDLALDDEITISTAPGAGLTAWGQAVQFFDERLTVHRGQRVSLRARVSDTRIEFRARV